ncbi:MAG: response regulator [Planctomycetota bacterium]
MKGTRAILVDDDDVNLITFGAILEDEGCSVTTASSLALGRAAIAAGRFDLAVLDVHLGDGLGPDLIPELRARNPGIVVAVVSGSLGHEERIVGPDLVLAKASDPKEILAQIEAALRSR